MLTLIDGPCKGSFLVKRAPFFLRAVLKRQLSGGGNLDVLDQVEDVPADDEMIFVYQRFGPTGSIHIDGKGIHGTYVIASYKLMIDVDGATLWDNQAWQAWAKMRLESIQKEGLSSDHQ